MATKEGYAPVAQSQHESDEDEGNALLYGEQGKGSEPPPQQPQRRCRLADLLCTRGYPALFLCGWLGNSSRWGAVFVIGHLTEELTHSPRLVELVGGIYFAPLLLGPFGGWLSDRYSRKVVLIVFNVLVVIPSSALISRTIEVGLLPTALLLTLAYVYIFIMGLGFVVDLTCRRALVSDVTAASLLPIAMAMESIGMQSASLIGNQFGGLAIEFLGGRPNAVALLACLQAVSTLLMCTVTVKRRAPPPRDGPGVVAQLVEGLRVLQTNRGLQSILGVTAIGNFFFGPFFPIVQVLAARMHVSPSLTGLLASASGYGGVTAAAFVVLAAPKRIGMLYWLGITATHVLMPFTALDSFWLVFAVIYVCGFGVGLCKTAVFFPVCRAVRLLTSANPKSIALAVGSNQSALVILTVAEEVKGRALGLLVLCIGASALGTFALGELAERAGTSASLVVFGVVGTVAQLAWFKYRPQAMFVLRS